MSSVWYHDPKYVAPYRSMDINESCVLACQYFSTFVDEFISQMPQQRLPNDWLDNKHTLADKVHLIFPAGFGEYDEQRNHNPRVWPAFVELSSAVAKGTTQEFAKDICESWNNFNDQMQLLQKIFDYLTCYLQLFVVLSDADFNCPDFVYPPEDAGGFLLGSIFRNPDLMSNGASSPGPLMA